MPSVTFDTHAAVKRLKDAGADERLAEAVVTTFGEAVTEHVATKGDITELRADLKTEIAKLETRFTNKLYGGIAILLVLSKVLDFLIGP